MPEWEGIAAAVLAARLAHGQRTCETTARDIMLTSIPGRGGREQRSQEVDGTPK